MCFIPIPSLPHLRVCVCMVRTKCEANLIIRLSHKIKTNKNNEDKKMKDQHVNVK